MDSYKHSCPRCGQHIEFTAEYCGKQIQCPSCGHTVTFPAVPPGRGAPTAQKPTSKAAARQAPNKTAAAAEPGPEWSWTPKGMLLYFRDFQHWNLVALCLVPFLILGALWAGASFVNKNFGNPAPPAPGPAVQADPGAFQRMTDLTKADEAVRAEMQTVAMAKTALARAERRGVGEQVAEKQRNLTIAQNQFDTAYANYQKLGGKVDYRSQLSRN